MSYSVDWNKEELIKMINLYKSKPELWDTECEDYKYRHKKQESWSEIAQEMNMDKFNVQRKMRSLIGQYHREVKKMQEGSQSKWFGYELLGFLNDKISKKTNGPMKNARTRDVVYFCSSDSRDDNFDYNSDEDDNSIKEENHLAETRSYSNPQKRQSTTFAEELPIKRSHDLSVRDEFTVFGEHVACKVRSISDPFLRSTLQNKINNLIYATEIQMYKNMETNRLVTQNQNRIDIDCIEIEDRKVFS